MSTTARRAAGSPFTSVLHRRRGAVGTLHPSRGHGRSRSRRRAGLALSPGQARTGSGSVPAVILVVAISACLISFFSLLAQLS